MSRMLIIDDDPVIRKIVQAYFTAKGHNVISAKDGKDGIERFRQGEYDIVITDLMMPNVHGFKVIDYIKLTPKGKHIPVILLTADVKEPELDAYDRKAFEDAYVSKPFDIPILEAKVKRALKEFADRDTD